MMTLTVYFAGLMTATFAASGLFFLKFWTASRDQFFLLFFLACELIAIERSVGVLTLAVRGAESSSDLRVGIYMIRLLAFVLILTAIIQRNRSSTVR